MIHRAHLLVRDQSLTLSQNYHRLGLTSKLNSRAGGTERLAADLQVKKTTGAKPLDPLSVSSRLSTTVIPTETQVERDPKTGAIIRVIHPFLDKNENPLNDPLNEISKEGDAAMMKLSTNGIIRRLEEQASVEVKQRPRKQSKREAEWISDLVQNYGDDYLGMVKDRKLNPYQQTEGDLRRRVKRWKEGNRN